MSSWYYAFMFPGSGKILRPVEAVRVLADAGMSFDRSIREAVVVDSSGHVEYVNEVKLIRSPVLELEERLGRDEQLLIECRNQELAFTLWSGTQYSNPYLVLSWSRNIFGSLGEEAQSKYLRLARNIARCCNATYIIVVNDPPDYFEDRFLEIDGRRLLDKHLPSGTEYDIWTVWIDTDSTDGLPDGVSHLPGTDAGEGFREYSLE